jgi:hypothetical protein
MMMEALLSSETSVLTRDTRRNITEDGILHVTAVKTSNLTLLTFPAMNRGLQQITSNVMTFIL